MRILPPLLACALLAGCSSQPASDTPESTQTAASPRDATDSAATPTAAVRPTQPSGLTGQVSALNSAVSGLDMRVTDHGTVIDLPADALFEFDRADLTPGATDQLSKSAQVLRNAPAGPIEVVGHTDSKGDEVYNQRLSEARARTVADWFGQQVGVRQRVFQVSGVGEAQPVAPNETADGKDDAAGRGRNRRVEVIIPTAS